jgi:hypothetical protein
MIAWVFLQKNMLAYMPPAQLPKDPDMIGAWKHTAFYVKIAIEMHKEHKTRQKLQEKNTFAQEVSDLRRLVHWLQGYSCQLTHSLFSCCLHLIVPVLPKTVVSLPILQHSKAQSVRYFGVLSHLLTF